MMKLFAIVLALMLSAPAMGQQVARGWGWAGIAYVTLEDQSRPTPIPAPKPGDPCKACLGTGKVGDGRVWQICKDCNGSGKVVGVPVSAIQQRAADVLLSHAPLAAPAPIPSDRPAIRSEPVTQSNCPGGVCPVPTNRPSVYSPPHQSTVRRGWIFRK